ncbi:MAG TPA: c-type cytochrome domain-containing protein, partial [Pirellulaceae bacterium]|nr:c-type cytochrome domain-containing protein [Pirellulaceae bacterium]
MWRCCLLLLILSTSSLEAADAPQYNRDVAPILTKYCTACHNADDKEGKLSLESFDAAMLGGANGAVITPRSGEQSRLIRVLNGAAKPVMPPKDNDAPTAAEVAILKAWIDAGAPGPSGKAPDPTIVVTPQIKPTVAVRSAINALAVNARGDIAALARFGEVELIDVVSGQSIRKLPGHRGRVSAVAFSADNRWLLTGAGEAGLIGEAKLWDVAAGECLKTWQAHRDCIYAVAISPDGKLLATGGYDQTIKLWSLERDEPLKTIEGHNGAVFALAFRKDGRVLASASEDRTVKLWEPASGARLDTLNQSTKELYTLAFSPDGQRLAAAGVDNRIRVWSISETVKEGTNPLLFSQFAHEAAVLRLAFSPDGASLISTGEDRLVKVW